MNAFDFLRYSTKRKLKKLFSKTNIMEKVHHNKKGTFSSSTYIKDRSLTRGHLPSFFNRMDPSSLDPVKSSPIVVALLQQFQYIGRTLKT